MLCFTGISAPDAWGSFRPAIVIINSYESSLEWVRSSNRVIVDAFSEDYTIHIFDMDTKRLPKSMYSEQADRALAFIQEHKPVLVFLSDDNAMSLLGHTLAQAGIHTVYYGINNNPRHYLENDDMKMVTGVLERPLFLRSLVYLSEIMPDMKKLLVLMDDSTTSRIVLTETFKNRISQHIGEVQVDVLLISQWDTWQAKVLDADSYGFDAIIATLMHTIRNGDEQDIVGFDKVARWTSTNSPVPTFGFWITDVGPDKATGGLVLFGEDQGKAAVEIAKRILTGESPGSILPVTADRGQLVFSQTQLHRWALTLPPDMLGNSVILP